jgi:DNA-binding NtrC family response regulator
MDTEATNHTPVRVPRILLVDDDPLFEAIMAHVAAREHISLTAVRSAKEIYRHLRELQFDVAILDYDLGRTTGFELATFLNSQGEKAPIIVVSAHVTIPKLRWPANVKDFFSKSVGPYPILGSAVRMFESESPVTG